MQQKPSNIFISHIHSSVYRILREYQLYGKASLVKTIYKLWDPQPYSHVGELIREYWLKQKSWVKINDIADYLLKLGNTDIKYNMLRIFMRNDLRLSFKKAFSRPVNMVVKCQNILKHTYTLEVSNIAISKMLLIIIGEVNFSYQTNNERILIPKGWSNPILNTCFQGTRCFMWEITSNGYIFIS